MHGLNFGDERSKWGAGPSRRACPRVYGGARRGSPQDVTWEQVPSSSFLASVPISPLCSFPKNKTKHKITYIFLKSSRFSQDRSIFSQDRKNTCNFMQQVGQVTLILLIIIIRAKTIMCTFGQVLILPEISRPLV